ncbi:MAG: glycosyl transferase family 1, partial [Gammaproteobacteria bacterium]
MKILFLHPNMPGQYKHLAAACGADPDNEVRFITHPGRPAIEGVKPITYPEKIPVQPDIAEPLAKAYLYKLYRCVTHSQQVRQRCLGLRREGFVPDIIVAHLGWGSGLFLKDVFPETPLLGYAEYFFTAERSEDSFLTGKPTNLHERERTRINNAQHLFSLTDADWCITPTRFQRDRHPALFHAKMSVLHDGIDTDAIAPDAQAGFTLPDGRRLTAADEVVTYISPVFEPHRGFPQFMAAV